jgi:hypothetical protein
MVNTLVDRRGLNIKIGGSGGSRGNERKEESSAEKVFFLDGRVLKHRFGIGRGMWVGVGGVRVAS